MYPNQITDRKRQLRNGALYVFGKSTESNPLFQYHLTIPRPLAA